MLVVCRPEQSLNLHDLPHETLCSIFMSFVNTADCIAFAATCSALCASSRRGAAALKPGLFSSRTWRGCGCCMRVLGTWAAQGGCGASRRKQWCTGEVTCTCAPTMRLLMILTTTGAGLTEQNSANSSVSFRCQNSANGQRLWHGRQSVAVSELEQGIKTRWRGKGDWECNFSRDVELFLPSPF